LDSWTKISIFWGIYPPRSYTKAGEGQRGDSRQPAWLHRGKVLPDQPSGLLCVTTSVDKGRAMDVAYLDFCKALTLSPTTSFSIDWREGFDGWTVQCMLQTRWMVASRG